MYVVTWAQKCTSIAVVNDMPLICHTFIADENCCVDTWIDDLPINGEGDNGEGTCTNGNSGVGNNGEG